MLRTINKQAKEYAVVAILFAGLAATAWQTYVNNRNEIRDHGKDIEALQSQVEETRQDFSTLRHKVAKALAADPKNIGIVADLVADVSFREGGESFHQGNYLKAFATWKQSAAQGTVESAFAIEGAKASLQKRIDDPATSAEERKRLEAALKAAPDVSHMTSETNDLMYRRPVEQPPKR